MNWSTHVRRQSLILVGALLFNYDVAVHAEEISNEIIRDITVAVKSLCSSPDKKGNNWSLEVTGEGVARLKLVGGVKGEVTFSREEWSGIKDSIADRPNLRDCVRDLVPQFLSKFAPSHTGGSSSLANEVMLTDFLPGWIKLFVKIQNDGQSVIEDLDIILIARVTLQANDATFDNELTPPDAV